MSTRFVTTVGADSRKLQLCHDVTETIMPTQGTFVTIADHLIASVDVVRLRLDRGPLVEVRLGLPNTDHFDETVAALKKAGWWEL